MNERLVTFLSRESDRNCGNSPANCPEESAWALLAEKLISPRQRDELLQHTQTCSRCRRRMSQIVAEWDDEVTVAGGRPFTLKTKPPGVHTLIRMRPLQYALAASVVGAVCLGIYFGGGGGGGPSGYGVDVSSFLAADASLTDLGVDLRRRNTRADVNPLINEALYRATIDRLREQLQTTNPAGDALAIAARAGLSARFFEDADAYAKQWTELTVEDPRAFNARGLALYGLNEFAAAQASFERAIELAPNQVNYRINAALAADEADRMDLARMHLLELKRIAPEHPQMAEINRWLQRLSDPGD